MPVDPIAAAIDEALAAGFVMLWYIRRELDELDRKALQRVKRLASVRELGLDATKARILVADIVESLHILKRHATELARVKASGLDAKEMHSLLDAYLAVARRHGLEEIARDAVSEARQVASFVDETSRLRSKISRSEVLPPEVLPPEAPPPVRTFIGRSMWEPLPPRVDSARPRALAWLSHSVKGLTGGWRDRIVKDLAKAVLNEAISLYDVRRSTGRKETP